MEGLLCAAFPGAMRRAMEEASHLSEHVMRTAGIVSAVIGVVVLWLMKGF